MFAIKTQKNIPIENRKPNSPTRSGFSLIEVIVTFAVLLIGIGAIMSLMSGSIKTSMNAKNQVVASMLAQEGIEMVRNLKDSNDAAFAALSNGTYANCRIDKSSTLYTNSSDAADRLYLDSNSFYIHGGSTKTKFSRKIMLDVDHTTNKQVTVTAMVSWKSADVDSFPTSADCNVSNKCMQIISVLADFK